MPGKVRVNQKQAAEVVFKMIHIHHNSVRAALRRALNGGLQYARDNHMLDGKKTAKGTLLPVAGADLPKRISNGQMSKRLYYSSNKTILRNDQMKKIFMSQNTKSNSDSIEGQMRILIDVDSVGNWGGFYDFTGKAEKLVRQSEYIPIRGKRKKSIGKAMPFVKRSFNKSVKEIFNKKFVI